LWPLLHYHYLLHHSSRGRPSPRQGRLKSHGVDAGDYSFRIPGSGLAAGLLEAIYEGGEAGTEVVVHGQIDVLGV
jgi:hypothetical protein